MYFCQYSRNKKSRHRSKLSERLFSLAARYSATTCGNIWRTANQSFSCRNRLQNRRARKLKYLSFLSSLLELALWDLIVLLFTLVEIITSLKVGRDLPWLASGNRWPRFNDLFSSLDLLELRWCDLVMLLSA